jgi:hypothetical protein
MAGKYIYPTTFINYVYLCKNVYVLRPNDLEMITNGANRYTGKSYANEKYSYH